MSNTPKRSIDELFFQMFYNVAKVSGVTFNPQQAEDFRAAAGRVGLLFESQVKEVAKTFIEQLQGATVSAFNKADKSFTEVNARLEKMEAALFDATNTSFREVTQEALERSSQNVKEIFTRLKDAEGKVKDLEIEVAVLEEAEKSIEESQ